MSAAGMWLVCTGIVTVLFIQGVFRLQLEQFLLIMGLIWVGLLGFPFVIASGINKRFKDPSLTISQIVWSVTWVLALSFFMHELRSVMLLTYMVIIAYGSFRLNMTQFFAITLYSILGYGLIVFFLNRFYPEDILVSRELIVWLSFSMAAGCLCWMGNEVSQLRNRLRAGNTELVTAMNQIHNLAVTDELTGAFNRRYIMDQLMGLKTKADNNGPAFSICFMDLDHFKKVNDTYGHNIGDEVLKRFAKVSQRGIRDTDFLARYGGEEFLLILGKTPGDTARIVGERIRGAVEDSDFGDLAAGLRVTVSVGITQYQENEDLDTLLARADAALYDAKGSGRNRVISN